MLSHRLRPLSLLFLFVLVLPKPTAAQTKAQRMDTLLTRFHEFGQFNGAVLAAEGGEVLFAKGYGDANMEWDIPNTPDTRFRIGSVTKQFTAALILQLAEEGRLDLQAHVTDYISNYPAETGNKVTIHHLLTHTSGIPSYTSLPDFFPSISRTPYEPFDFLDVFSGMDLEFEPGTSWKYSNSGYFLLGVIIEVVTGRSYEEVLRARIIEPFGLTNTGYDNFDEIIERRAAGYLQSGSDYVNAPYLDTSLPYAAGMMYSTVGDLLVWNRALHSGAVFEKPETLTMMTTPYAEEYGYGLGIQTATVGELSVSTIRHSGGINGFSAQLWYMPDEDYTIAVLDNTAGDTGRIADVVARILYDQPASGPLQPISMVLSAIIDSQGIDAAEARYRDLKANAADTYDFQESELNVLGYHYLRMDDVETAIRIFQLNVEAYPEASNPYDSLGEAYAKAGENELAIENYQKALALHPGALSARDALERLGVEVEREPVRVPDDVLESYLGRYQIQPTFAIEVTRDGPHLYAQATGQGRFEIFPSAENEFYLTVVDARITFNRSEDGEVASLTLHQNGQHMPAAKVE